VPLERRCVRFIDNFSAGHRGALSTEQFLEVIRQAWTDLKSYCTNPFFLVAQAHLFIFFG